MDIEKIEAQIRSSLPNASDLEVRFMNDFERGRIDIAFKPYYEDVELYGSKFRVFYPDINNDMGGLLKNDKTLRISFVHDDAIEINQAFIFSDSQRLVKSDAGGEMWLADNQAIEVKNIPSLSEYEAYITII